jgi:catechol 2,3-dioxygenase-like lactoylglutathione lyase family enzyme
MLRALVSHLARRSIDRMPEHQDQPYWRGINHLALITNDMDATVRFYHGVLGARLVATLGTEGFRQCFCDLGAQCTVAFFEYRDQPFVRFAKPAGVPDPRAIQFDHLSLNLPDEQALESLRARLKEHDCEVTDVVDHQVMRSIYFTDPNGIALEASWWVRDATATESGFDDEMHLHGRGRDLGRVRRDQAGSGMSVGSCTRRVAGVLARRPASTSSRTAGTGSRSPKRLRSP